jgi:hypothetical protein
MIGKQVITNQDLVVEIQDKIRVSAHRCNVDNYVCKVLENLNGDTSEYGKAIIISPQQIVSFNN